MPLSWSLYDFANTIFSYAVVSTAMGIWLTEPERLGEANGQLVFGLAVIISVGLNAIFSPVLGAMSDRGGVMAALPALLHGPRHRAFVVHRLRASVAGLQPAAIGAILFAIANFAYQAALIFYDATLKTVSLPQSRGRLSGIGVGIGYMGTISVGLLLAVATVDVAT